MNVMANLNYAIVTPARNEEKYIERTIKSMVQQTVKPLRWVIVSDGSTDKTDDIIRQYAQQYEWIDFIRIPNDERRNFASKVTAFNTGLKAIEDLSYEVIGCLDADVSFPADYFEYLIGKFGQDPQLGVAGTHYTEGDSHSYNDSFINEHHVNGGCQMFRKECFKEIGGYQKIRHGGIDWIAVTTARMKGWKTHSFGERVFEHHRKIGTAEANVFISRYRYGRKDYFLGGHPAWELLRGAFHCTKPPCLIGGLCLLAGYFFHFCIGSPKHVSKELMKFHRHEQVSRLKALVGSKFRIRRLSRAD